MCVPAKRNGWEEIAPKENAPTCEPGRTLHNTAVTLITTPSVGTGELATALRVNARVMRALRARVAAVWLVLTIAVATELANSSRNWLRTQTSVWEGLLESRTLRGTKKRLWAANATPITRDMTATAACAPREMIR